MAGRIMNKVGTALFGCAALAAVYGGSATAKEKVVLTISATQQEYMAQDRAIWDIYEEENPNVEIKLIVVNLETEAAYQAQVAAGNPADIRMTSYPGIDNYKRYLNLCAEDVQNWKYMAYDARNVFDQMAGTKGYCPAFNVRRMPYFSFMFYVDEMKKAELDPKNTVKSLDDLRKFLAKLKVYVDSRDDMNYVLDAGWHAQLTGRWIPEAWAVGMGATKQDLRDVFLGKIKWTDQEKNPFVPVFKLYKEFYDLDYMPKRWWTRAFKTEYEAGLIAHKSMFTFHGPWMWDKILAQNPDEVMDGFFWPANKEGKLWAGAVTTDRGATMYVANKDKPNFEATLKAFNWFNSPEIVKLRAEAIGFLPAMDMSSVGGVDITTQQYTKLIKPVLDGAVKGVSFDDTLCGECAAEFMKKKGTPRVMADNAVAEILGDYLEGTTTLAQFLDILQARYDNAYVQ